MILPNVIREKPTYPPTVESFSKPIPYGNLTHMRIHVCCYSNLIADKVFEAMVKLGYENPEVQSKSVYSWDTNSEVIQYSVKCWYPVTLNYQDAISKIKELVFNETPEQSVNER